MKFEVEIETRKTVIIEAEDKHDAINKANEIPLEINDFEWMFDAEELE